MMFGGPSLLFRPLVELVGAKFGEAWPVPPLNPPMNLISNCNPNVSLTLNPNHNPTRYLNP